MKKIILSLIALMAAVSTNAQVLEVYENGFLTKTYKNTTGASTALCSKVRGKTHQSTTMSLWRSVA